MRSPTPAFPPLAANPALAPARGLLALALLAALAACGSTGGGKAPSNEMSSEGQALFGGKQGNPAAPPSTAPDANAWTIVIVAFRGEDHEAAARAGLARARTIGSLREAYLQNQPTRSAIAYGHYASPDQPQAQADLKRIREIVVDGGRPFAGAVLAPPEGAGTGRNPELDLRHARSTFGKDALYSLQIAAYGRGNGPPRSEQERAEFVRAAEDAAAQLRREGEQAFYYHGPNLSIVTIGIFGASDYEPQYPERRSDRLRAAQEAHPYNLLNGKGLWVRAKGVPENSPSARRMATSFLIAIPNEE